MVWGKGDDLILYPHFPTLIFNPLNRKNSVSFTHGRSTTHWKFLFSKFCAFFQKKIQHHNCIIIVVCREEREIQRVTRQRKACLVVYQHHQHDLNFFYSQQRSKHLVIWFLKPMESAGTWDSTQVTTSDVI